jgi:hypothetical protein
MPTGEPLNITTHGGQKKKRVAGPSKGARLEEAALTKKVPEPDYPWDQQVDESAAAFLAFAAYRDMGLGMRSIRKVRAAVGKGSHSTLSQWNTQHEWLRRVTAWDAHNDQESLSRSRSPRQQPRWPALCPRRSQA